jgi:hypothetical protein
MAGGVRAIKFPAQTVQLPKTSTLKTSPGAHSATTSNGRQHTSQSVVKRWLATLVSIAVANDRPQNGHWMVANSSMHKSNRARPKCNSALNNKKISGHVGNMAEAIKWQENMIVVKARLVPKFLWSTASIDVFLNEQCILQTGGQMKLTGSYSTAFEHSGVTRKAELSWGIGGLFSFPYKLRIDDNLISDSRVRVQN